MFIYFFVYHPSEKKVQTLIIILIMVWKMRMLECSLAIFLEVSLFSIPII